MAERGARGLSSLDRDLRGGGSTGIRTLDQWIKKAPFAEENGPNTENETKSADEQDRGKPAFGAVVGNQSEPDAVELAISKALTEATKAQRWELVAQLASELSARRRDRAGTVDLVAERAKRGQR